MLGIRFCICLYFLLFFGSLFSQDSARYIKVGIIPYQFCSRGPAAYISWDGKKYSCEFRPAYTIATKWVTWWVPTKHDKYFFQGLDMDFLFRKFSPYRKSPRILIGYRYWWYTRQLVFKEQKYVSISSSDAQQEYRSAWKHGLLLGVEFSKQVVLERMDLNLFLNSGFVFYEGKQFNYNYSANGSVADTYYNTAKIERADFVAALGIKIGINKNITR